LKGGWQAGGPMSYSFPKTANPAFIVGRTPWSARVPLDPLYGNGINLIPRWRAGQGAVRGPGGPPHNKCRMSGYEKTI
jgi:hypothetical protein